MHSNFVKTVVAEVQSKTPTGRRRYSSYMEGYVQGLYRASTNHIMQYEVEFCYKYKDTLYTTSKKNPSKPTTKELYGMNPPVDFNNLERGFYWVGSERPF
jgi:hypothetical protein